MLCFGLGIFGYLLFLSTMYTENQVYSRITYVSLGLNLFCFFKTMFGDPGIDQSIYDHYFKMLFGQKTKEETVDLEDSNKEIDKI